MVDRRSKAMTTTKIGKAISQLIFKVGAIHVSTGQPFILAAGWASPVYVDCRVLLGDPDRMHAVTDLAVEYATATFPPGSFDAIAGAETAGIPFASWFASLADGRLDH